ncbi:MAG: hypothetical protein A3F13_02780 [Gammaproteobacteria bacterium RIFCSPHIGHO2_12_FULL_40_19]|nr:MAG: hypothetical protein A3F13_02780 [Gammaproteobacteria bacterium RIFCSPHIGHO2_12_FULL_40_19]
MKSDEARIYDISAELIEVLAEETPAIGSAAMIHLLASHTQDNREDFLTQMGNIWDHYHKDKK